jgi:hypothetical protein
VIGQNITPNATPIHTSPLDLGAPADAAAAAPAGGRGGRGGGGGRGGRGGAVTPGAPDAAAAGRGDFGGGRGGAPNENRARVVLQFTSNPDNLLLSGTLAGADALQGRAAAIDAPLGKGHIVMFAIRPFWRWQTQGTYSLAFNAIVNWDHLDAGK